MEKSPSLTCVDVKTNIWLEKQSEICPRIVLIAHDACKLELAEWAQYNSGTLAKCTLFATATTGTRVAELVNLPVNRLLSGALGGDAQVGAMLAEQRLAAA